MRSSAVIARQFSAGPSMCSAPSMEPANRAASSPFAVVSQGFRRARSTFEKLSVAEPG